MKKKEKYRYSAMLLFQYRTVKGTIVNQKRVCEERIIIFKATSAKRAFAMAQKRGRAEEFSYTDEGADIFFEFIGVIELVELGIYSEPDEVWWRLIEKVRPMERRDKLVPSEVNLSALRSRPASKHRRLSVP